MRGEVHKFGGASVKDAEGVRNVGRILSATADRGLRLGVVISAMGKMTNALEEVWSLLPEAADVDSICRNVREYHEGILKDLGLGWHVLEGDWAQLLATAERLAGRSQDSRGYDALVGFGERMSTRIVHAHLEREGLPVRWLSAWEMIRTDDRHRSARVDLGPTGEAIRQAFGVLGDSIGITQGFVGGTPEGLPTTLGREGSDFSGALVAEAMDAERLVVWKDVPGVMTGDPRKWPLARRLDALDHGSAERLSRAGAGVLHPDTMAPLQRGGIPLEVRSFVAPDRPGTTIGGHERVPSLPNLWAFAATAQGEVVRCLTSDAASAVEEWMQAFPGESMPVALPDPEIEGCFRIVSEVPVP